MSEAVLDPRVLRAEAELFGRYLIGRAPGAGACDVYVQAVSASDLVHGEKDARLLSFARGRPWSIGLLDAGLGLLDAQAELRRRLHLMFAILELTPQHHDRFLPEPRRPAYAAVVALAGLRGIIKAAAGSVLILALTR